MATLLVWAILACTAGFGVAKLRVETSTDSILSRSDPAWAFYRNSVELFGGDEIVVAAFEVSSPYDHHGLALVESLTDQLEQVPGVRRVDSLSSVPNIRVDSDGSLLLDSVLSGRRDRTDPSTRALIADEVSRDRLAKRSIVSDDGTVMAVNVLMEDLGAEFDGPVVSSVMSALGSHEAWVTGGPVFRTETNRQTQSQVMSFVPITILIIAALLYGLFRTIRGVVIPLVASGLGSWFAVAAMGVTGTPLTISTMILPSILLALGCAYSMHLMSAAAGISDEEALVKAASNVARPIALSGLTTAIGFVSMSMVRIESIQFLGTFGSIGVVAVLSAILSLAPACLKIWPIPDGKIAFKRQLSGGISDFLSRFCVVHRGAIVGVWSLVVALLTVGVFRLEIETDVTRWFPEGTHIRDSYEEVRERLSGISPMNVVITSSSGASVATAEMVEAIDGLDAYLSAQPEVGKVVSLADPLRQIHGGFIGDAEMPLPPEDDLISQYLLLLESVDHLSDVVTDDRSAANVMIRANDNGSIDLLDLAARAEDWWSWNGVEGFAARTTGIMFEYARAEDEIAYGQIRGLAVAFGVIGVLLMMILREIRVTAAALVPNAVPIAMAFGFMGLVGIPLDAGTVSVGCLALGIAVDDTIHVVMGYQDRVRLGASAIQALRGTFEQVVQPLTYTTLAVSLGFLVLGLSEFTIIRSLGLLTAGLMVICLLADVTLLPALLGSDGSKALDPQNEPSAS